MTEITEKVDQRNSTVTIIASTYCVRLHARYMTAIREGDRLAVGAHMTEEEARALLAGLQEALA